MKLAVVRLFTDEELSEQVKKIFNEKIRAYAMSPVMGKYSRALAYKPVLLEELGDEHLHVMVTRTLPRRLKEMIAVAVSMFKGCSYCITSHVEMLKKLFNATDEEIVEIAAVVSHVSGLNIFEKFYIKNEKLVHSVSEHKVGLLKEIKQTLGSVPLYYRIIAKDPKYLGMIWKREKATMFEGRLSRKEKEILALATCVADGALDSAKLHLKFLKKMGVRDEEIFECLTVVAAFMKNTTFTTGLQLDVPPPEWVAGLVRK